MLQFTCIHYYAMLICRLLFCLRVDTPPQLKRQKNQKNDLTISKGKERLDKEDHILVYLRAPSLFGSTFSKSHIFGAISGFLPQLKKL